MDYVYLGAQGTQSDSLHPPAIIYQEPVVLQTQNEQASVHIYGKYENEVLRFPDSDVLSEYISLDVELQEFITTLAANEAEIIVVDGEKILVLITPYLLFGEENAIISLLAMNSVNALTFSNIKVFAAVFIVLVVLSFLLICWQSMKITAPLNTLTTRAERYASHDFSEPFAIDTKDEIESLSCSIQIMVESILQHETSQIALFRNLSHELKTPLTAISGYAENIGNGYYNDTSVPLKIIQDECIRIRNILDNLIFLSNIDSNMEVFSCQQWDIVQLVTDCIEKVESIAILNDIDIYYIPPSEISVFCDREKLMRAFINVLSNALKYAKDSIEVQITQRDGMVSISIADNGNGFDESKLDKLFVTTTGASIDGNGMGLLIVNEIIKRHNGTITAQNRATGGALIYITLACET